MFPPLFLSPICNNWLQETTEIKRTGIGWTMSKLFENLGFAYDISQTRHCDLQGRTGPMAEDQG